MHHTLTLDPAWAHQAAVDVSGHSRTDSQDTAPEIRGRAALSFDCGSFSLSLRPTPAQLRALADLCLALAQDQEAANVPPYTGERLRWPAGLTHLPAAPAAAEKAAA